MHSGNQNLMWRELIGSLFADAKFREPAKADHIARVERELGVALPTELAGLLAETDGVSANYSAPLVWSVDEIVEQNRFFRSNADFADLSISFDDLLFFGADGGGDQFAYPILDGRIPETSGVYRWNHETDARDGFASDLKDYFRRSGPKAE